MKRYVKEYADDRIRRLKEERKTCEMTGNAETDLKLDAMYAKAIKYVSSWRDACSYGYIAEDEAMRLIATVMDRVIGEAISND